MLDSESGEPCVRNLRSRDICVTAQSLKNCPMPLSWLHDLAKRLLEEVVAVGEGFSEGARLTEGPWLLCRDPDDRAQRQRRYAKSRVSTDHIVEPGFANRMMRGIAAERVNQHVHVWQDHRSRFTYSRSSSSCSAAELFRSIPGRNPPVAVLTGGRTRLALGADDCSSTTRRNPSSRSEVRDRPSCAAFRLARRMSSSGRRTVVRSVICHDISMACRDVKR